MSGPDSREWCADYREVTLFGRYLLDEGLEADELQEYYESPWKWTAERAEMLRGEADPVEVTAREEETA